MPSPGGEPTPYPLLAEHRLVGAAGRVVLVGGVVGAQHEPVAGGDHLQVHLPRLRVAQAAIAPFHRLDGHQGDLLHGALRRDARSPSPRRRPPGVVGHLRLGRRRRRAPACPSARGRPLRRGAGASGLTSSVGVTSTASFRRAAHQQGQRHHQGRYQYASMAHQASPPPARAAAPSPLVSPRMTLFPESAFLTRLTTPPADDMLPALDSP